MGEKVITLLPTDNRSSQSFAYLRSPVILYFSFSFSFIVFFITEIFPVIITATGLGCNSMTETIFRYALPYIQFPDPSSSLKERKKCNNYSYNLLTSFKEEPNPRGLECQACPPSKKGLNHSFPRENSSFQVIIILRWATLIIG